MPGEEQPTPSALNEDYPPSEVPSSHAPHSHDSRLPALRIALITPYNGGNFGDALIQDSVIANIRARCPNAEFSGITLNSDNFLDRHGERAFPILDTRSPFYRVANGRIEDWIRSEGMEASGRPDASRLKALLLKVPLVGTLLRGSYRGLQRLRREIRHTIAGYRFLDDHDLVLVSGGGQLDEEWGGPWHHPFALFKWAILARLAKIPFAIASVGACKAESPVSRFFLAQALRLAAYRSYRDQNSRSIAVTFYSPASQDPIVPDLAFSLPDSEFPAAPPRLFAPGRPVVAISPIAYAKPGNWPHEDASAYERYVEQMSSLISSLLNRNYCIVIIWSSVGDDQSVIPEILERVGPKEKLPAQLLIPTINSWRDLLAILKNADLMVASRLHSVICGVLAAIPTIAVSFDPKVDWLMDDLQQKARLLQIRTFSSEQIVQLLEQVKELRAETRKAFRTYRERLEPDFSRQYRELLTLSRGEVSRPDFN